MTMSIANGSALTILTNKLEVSALAGNSVSFTIPFYNRVIIKTIRCEAFYTDQVTGLLTPALDSGFDINFQDEQANGMKVYESVSNTYLDYDMVEIPYIDASRTNQIYGTIINKDLLLNITYKILIRSLRAE